MEYKKFLELDTALSEQGYWSSIILNFYTHIFSNILKEEEETDIEGQHVNVLSMLCYDLF